MSPSEDSHCLLPYSIMVTFPKIKAGIKMGCSWNKCSGLLIHFCSCPAYLLVCEFFHCDIRLTVTSGNTFFPLQWWLALAMLSGRNAHRREMTVISLIDRLTAHNDTAAPSEGLKYRNSLSHSSRALCNWGVSKTQTHSFPSYSLKISLPSTTRDIRSRYYWFCPVIRKGCLWILFL